MRALRIIAALLAILLTFTCTAEEITSEIISATMEMMFAAASGVVMEENSEPAPEMTEEELAAQIISRAEYRKIALAWLMAAFNPEFLTDELEEIPAEEPEEIPAEEPSPTPEDSFSAFCETEPGKAYIAQLEFLGGSDWESCLEIMREICSAWLSQIDHEMLLEMNADYACWLYAPHTQIDYPVVLGADNSHYLHRMFNGEYNSAGTLFLDYRNLRDFQDPNTLVYGHHMRNDSMFGTLTDYTSQEYFETHPYMLVMDADEIFLLEIFAGYTTDKRDHCYDIAISDEDDMRAFLEEALEKSDFVSCVEPDPASRLATLSTCAYAFENARYILICRLVPVFRAEPEAELQ